MSAIGRSAAIVCVLLGLAAPAFAAKSPYPPPATAAPPPPTSYLAPPPPEAPPPAASDEPCRDTRDAGGASRYGSPNLRGAPAIDTLVLYAEQSLRLGRCDVVEVGDLGVRSRSAAMPDDALRIGVRSAAPRSRLASPSIEIARGVAYGAIATDRFTDDHVPLGVADPFPAAEMPPLPLAPGNPGSHTVVTVSPGMVVQLFPGRFGTLTVEGELHLNPGHYTIAKLNVADDGRILAINGDVRLDIAETLTLGRRATLSPDFDRDAAHFTVTVAGSDDAGRPAASFGERSRVRALVAAPHGTLGIADHSLARGAFAGFDVAVGADVRVAFENGFPLESVSAQGSQPLPGYFTPAIRDAVVDGPVPRTQVIALAIGLPVKDAAALQQAARNAADPTSPAFRKYLTPAQFAAAHGASDADYQAVVDWATAKGLTVAATHPNHLLVDVTGTAEQVERALFISLTQRLRPDGSRFFAVDRDPSIDLPVKLLWISGLDNLKIAVPGAGAGPGGSYNSADLHTAYTSCTASTGAGQSVGLFELDGFTPGDITGYECQAGGATCNAAGAVTSTVPTVTTTLLDKATGTPATVAGSFEAALDIEMAIGTAPGLSQVQVYEAPNGGSVTFANDILTAMATTLPLTSQFSSSWFFATDANTQPILYEMALQGQTFLQASGDEGSSSWTTDPGDIRSLDAVTVVGGTALTLTGAPSVYGSETPWNSNRQGAGGGGIAANTPIPAYQTGISMAANGGSTTKRNLPDVSAVAANLAVVSTNPTTGTQATGNAIGTSAAAPIWAGLVAIANQTSLATPTGAGLLGNANPLLYSLAKNPTAYAASFHDIAAGTNSGTCTGATGTSSAVCSVPVRNPVTGVTANQNTWTTSVSTFSAVAGYDLATGLGTPQCALLNELATGATTATASTPVTIRYHQTGACNGFTTPFGLTGAGANQAYVIFGIERIDNSGGAAPFAFDPTKLFVQQAIRNFVDPGLQLYANVLGPFAAVSTSLTAGQNLAFAPSGQAGLVVQTVNVNGAAEADNTAYSLRYNGSPADPTVVLTRSDAGQTSWPSTEDCKTIALH